MEMYQINIIFYLYYYNSYHKCELYDYSETLFSTTPYCTFKGACVLFLRKKFKLFNIYSIDYVTTQTQIFFFQTE